eukprot:1320609-Amorphochlora_amoeboformis.AAC.1
MELTVLTVLIRLAANNERQQQHRTTATTTNASHIKERRHSHQRPPPTSTNDSASDTKGESTSKGLSNVPSRMSSSACHSLAGNHEKASK